MFFHQIKASHQSGMHMSDYVHSTDTDSCIPHLRMNYMGFDLLRQLTISEMCQTVVNISIITSIVCRYASLVDSRKKEF